MSANKMVWAIGGRAKPDKYLIRTGRPPDGIAAERWPDRSSQAPLGTDFRPADRGLPGPRRYQQLLRPTSSPLAWETYAPLSGARRGREPTVEPDCFSLVRIYGRC